MCLGESVTYLLERTRATALDLDFTSDRFHAPGRTRFWRSKFPLNREHPLTPALSPTPWRRGRRSLGLRTIPGFDRLFEGNSFPGSPGLFIVTAYKAPEGWRSPGPWRELVSRLSIKLFDAF
jgi:hypothetical protein